MSFTVTGLTRIGEIVAGTDLLGVITAALESNGLVLEDGDILVVTSKIVSKAEGRSAPAEDREAVIAAETVRVVAERGPVRIVENRLGIVAAAAGVDASNTPDGTILLLPLDPDASARSICAGLRERSGARVGVLVSDTVGRPWRLGQTDIAIGAAGVRVIEDLRDCLDAGGRRLGVTMPCVADQICGAAELAAPKAAGIPVTLVRGLGRFVGDLDLPGARSIQRPPEDDLFR